MRVQRVALFLVSFSFVVLVWFGLYKLSLLCPLCAVYFILFPTCGHGMAFYVGHILYRPPPVRETQAYPPPKLALEPSEKKDSLTILF